MSASSAKPSACLGFLSVIESRDLGLLGGYLLLNAAGRPLEFHCTAPVRPTRTQEILYGPTLKPFLYGEQIGLTLLAKGRQTPVAALTDCDAVLAVREQCGFPLVQILSPDALDSGFPLGLSRAATAAGFESDREQVRAAWPVQAEHLDLNEPFARIREALEEAHRGAVKAA